MKRLILGLTLLLASTFVFASCLASTAVGGGAPLVTGFNAASGNMTAYLYFDSYNPADGDGAVAPGTCTGGCDSTGIATVECDTSTSVIVDGPCRGDVAGNYYGNSDWGNSVEFDGCPGIAGTIRATYLIWDIDGNWALLSHDQTGDSWVNFGVNPATVAGPHTFSDATATVIAQNGANVDVTWAALPAATIYGSYGDSMPAAPYVTSFNVYTYEGPAAPVAFNTGSWTLNTTGVSTGTAMSTIAYTSPAAGNGLWLSRSIVVSGIEVPFVSSAPVQLFVPSGASVISSMIANKAGLDTNVTWTSSDESKVTGYQIYWAALGGDYSPIGSVVQPAGNNHTYNQAVRIPATGQFTVKVGANLLDGTTEYSTVATINPSSVIKNRSRAVPN